jgi:predicted metal-dependent HD superfamily phosphohydrolase
MIDIDLSIFGRSDVEFDAYESAIRAEYAWVAEPAFREGRGRIVEAFLARPQIFVTTPFRSKYEIVARANLLRSIEKLKLPLP